MQFPNMMLKETWPVQTRYFDAVGLLLLSSQCNDEKSFSFTSVHNVSVLRLIFLVLTSI